MVFLKGWIKTTDLSIRDLFSEVTLFTPFSEVKNHQGHFESLLTHNLGRYEMLVCEFVYIHISSRASFLGGICFIDPDLLSLIWVHLEESRCWLLISINFTPKTSHSCLKFWYFCMFSRQLGFSDLSQATLKKKAPTLCCWCFCLRSRCECRWQSGGEICQK